MATTVRDERGLTLPQRKTLRSMATEAGQCWSFDVPTPVGDRLVALGLVESDLPPSFRRRDWRLRSRPMFRLTDEGVLVAALLMIENPLGEPEPSMADKRAEFLRDWGQPVGANVGGPLGILPAPADAVPVLDDEP